MTTTTIDAQRFKALSEPPRLALLHIIAQGEGKLNVIELRKRLNTQLHAKYEQATVSHHLALLRNAGLVTYRRNGMGSYYQLSGEPLVQIMDALVKLITSQEARV